MFPKLEPLKLPDEQEERFRQFYLQADIKQTILGALLYGVPLFGFVFNDYQLFGLTATFYGLALLRCCLLVFTVSVMSYLYKAQSYRTYDKIVPLTVMVLSICGGIINASRPQNFIVHVMIALIAVFVLYLVIFNRFIYQVLLSASVSIGEVLIIVLSGRPSEVTTLFTIMFCMLFANIIAFVSSWRLHSYRRRNFLEITKRQELQQALEQYTKDLEALVAERTEKLKSAEHLATIGATAGMVGHDIRNPLTAITGAVYLAKKDLTKVPDSQAKEQLKKNIELIGEQTVYINKIVDDLRDYARPLNPQIKEAYVEQTLQLALSAIKPSDKITVEFSTEGKLKLKTDPLYLQRILINLLNNAIEAMPNGGKLTIKASTKEGKAIISVEDTGEGIPEEVRSKMFTPLITTKAKGQGFGLAVVKRLTEALSGTITVESVVGKGTKFIIELPQ